MQFKPLTNKEVLTIVERIESEIHNLKRLYPRQKNHIIPIKDVNVLCERVRTLLNIEELKKEI